MTNILLQIQDTLVRKLNHKFITVLHYSPMPDDSRLLVQVTHDPYILGIPSDYLRVCNQFELICKQLEIIYDNQIFDRDYILTIPNNDLIAFHGALELV